MAFPETTWKIWWFDETNEDVPSKRIWIVPALCLQRNRYRTCTYNARNQPANLNFDWLRTSFENGKNMKKTTRKNQGILVTFWTCPSKSAESARNAKKKSGLRIPSWGRPPGPGILVLDIPLSCFWVHVSTKTWDILIQYSMSQVSTALQDGAYVFHQS